MAAASDETKTVTPHDTGEHTTSPAAAAQTGADPGELTRVVSQDDEGSAAQSSAGRPRQPAVARGEQIGRYVILGRTGAGGMGEVYAAYDPELDRKVALKLLPAQSRRAEADDGEARLLREAQAMAKLSHANVIAVHDAGTYDGHVFIAMEFIEGVTLKEWLDAAPRNWAQVLSVLIPAGRGLAAAHQAGIIHRDFKPANVMIREDGAVRVLDFGLARRVEGQTTSLADADELTRSRDSLDGNLTRTGLVTGTPAYMAPEQFAGIDQDERTDQFGFCVALYESVYGERPFEGKELKTLSKAVRTGKLRPVPSGSKVPQRLRRCIRRGLSPDPAARYPSMSALIADLERAARPRWRRYAPWTGGFAGVAVLATAIAMPKAVTDDAPCQDAAARLDGVWDDATQQRIEAAFTGVEREYSARAWQQVQARLDGYADAWVAQHTEACEATRVRAEQSEDLLDRRMACLDRRRAELGALTDVFTEADAQIVEKAVEATGKLPPLSACEQANVLLDRVPPPDDAIAAEVESQRATLARIKVLFNSGKYVESLEPSREALAAARELGYRPLITHALQNHGSVLMSIGKGEEALPLLEEGLLLAEATGDDEFELRLRITLTSLVGMYMADPPGGREHAAFARAVSERVPLHGELVGTVEVVEGIVDYRAGDFAQARRKLEVALDKRMALGERSEGVAMVLTNLSAALVELGEYEQALEAIERALEIQRSLHGPSHPIVGTITNNLSLVYFRLGDHESALRYGNEAIEVWRRALPPGHPDLAKALHNVGAMLSKLGRYEQALARYEQALEIKRAALGEDDPSVAVSVANIADTLNQMERHTEALPYVQRAAQTLVAKLGPDHPQLGGVYATYAASLLGAGDREQALEMLHRSQKILDTQPGLLEDRADMQMLLARALWPDAAQREAARAAALQARDTYQTLGAGFDASVREVDAWLSAHST